MPLNNTKSRLSILPPLVLGLFVCLTSSWPLSALGFFPCTNAWKPFTIITPKSFSCLRPNTRGRRISMWSCRIRSRISISGRIRSGQRSVQYIWCRQRTSSRISPWRRASRRIRPWRIAISRSKPWRRTSRHISSWRHASRSHPAEINEVAAKQTFIVQNKSTLKKPLLFQICKTIHHIK